MVKKKKKLVKRAYIGIDPGNSGAVVLLGPSLLSDSKHAYRVVVRKLKDQTPRDVWDIIQELVQPDERPFAVLEKVTGFIPGRPQPGSRMFTFGRGVGWLQMALLAAEIPHEEIQPQKWQKALGIPHKEKKEKDGAFKNRLKAFAQKLFPQEKIIKDTADAFLIAEYCKRHYRGAIL